jgi:sarcosine oxidase subunit alpha
MIKLKINNKDLRVESGVTVATAIFAAETFAFRRSVTGQPRFPFCGMGICFECRVTINGKMHQKSCQISAEDGMIVETDE